MKRKVKKREFLPDCPTCRKEQPTLADMKRDKEAMKAIQYLRDHYTIGAVLAVYQCPELDKSFGG